MQSEAASESSRAPGPAKRAQGERGSALSSSPTLEVVFDSQRLKHLGFAAGYAIVGALLVYALGAVLKVLGLILLVFAALRAIKLARCALGSDAVIRIDDEAAHLPKTLVTPKADRARLAYDELANVFYLRRSLAWFRTSPVLIVETRAGEVYRFPRDWFASDADQRRVAEGLSARLGRLPSRDLIVPLEPSDATRDRKATSRRNRALAFFIASGALVMMGNLGLAEFLTTVNLPTTTVYVASGLSFAIGAYFLLVVPPPSKGQRPAK